MSLKPPLLAFLPTTQTPLRTRTAQNFRCFYYIARRPKAQGQKRGFPRFGRKEPSVQSTESRRAVRKMGLSRGLTNSPQDCLSRRSGAVGLFKSSSPQDQTTAPTAGYAVGAAVWCGRWDLNPHVMDTRTSNVPVCRFQHFRLYFCNTWLQGIFYHIPGSKVKPFCATNSQETPPPQIFVHLRGIQRLNFRHTLL